MLPSFNSDAFKDKLLNTGSPQKVKMTMISNPSKKSCNLVTSVDMKKHCKVVPFLHN